MRSRFVLAAAVLGFAIAGHAATGVATAPTTAPSLTFTSDSFGHNFAGDSGEVVLRISAGAGATGGQVRVTDETGRVVQQITVPAGDTAVTVPLKGRGYYEISAALTAEVGKLSAKTSASVVGALLPNELRLGSPFGFFSVKGDTPLPVVAGAGWNRLFIPTNGVEKDASGALKWWRPVAPGPKPPQTVNGTPAPLRWVGVFMLPPVSLVAPEHRAKHNNHNIYPPTDWDEFRRVVEFAARHYLQWVEYFEPINEPDAVWRGTNEELVRYHQVVAEAVHAADPKRKVVGPCLCEIDLSRLRKLASLGLFDHLDGLSIHAYANDAPPEGKWWQSVRELREFLRSIGKQSMPIVISEYGWQTAAGDWARPVDQLSQARYASRSLTLLAAEQVDAINYFCLRYDDARIPHVQGWSVVERDNTPRPAFAAIANVTRWLSGVKGRGTVLHPAPDTYLVLFRKGTGSMAVAWTTRGESTLRIPGRWGRISDMTGRDMSASADGEVKLTESPVFIELEDASLPAVRLRDGVSVLRGGEVELPGDWAGASLPSPLKLKGNRLGVPDDAPSGDYLAMVKGSEGDWTAAPVKVLPRFAVETAGLHWPPGASSPVVRLRVRSHGQAVDLLPIVRLSGAAARFGQIATVPAQEVRTLEVGLQDLTLGRRWSGVAAVEGRVNGRVESVEMPLEIAIVPGSHIASSAAIDWSAVPKSSSRGWRTFGGPSPDAPLGPEDCSAALQWAWSERGLHLRIEVQDNEHVQDREPSQMWQQDSLQFAFDADADKPWQMNVNNDLVGLNGHRVFEYGVAMRGGRAGTARWRESIVALPADVPPVEATASRAGTLTLYEITFPWPSLGLSQAPAAGTSIGFDLVVNDVDAAPNRRHGLEIFGGINSSKDPERFGRLLLR